MSTLDQIYSSKIIDYYLSAIVSERKAKKTVKNYKFNLGLFLKHIADMSLKEVSAIHIRDYQAKRAQTVKPTTQHQAFRVLRTFFNWCLLEEFIEKSPMS